MITQDSITALWIATIPANLFIAFTDNSMISLLAVILTLPIMYTPAKQFLSKILSNKG